MRLIKAEWVNHEGQPIYSVDMQKGDVRFATGGQSPNGSGLVVIWNLAPLLDSELENDKNVVKILAKLESHTACVNCVRWSESGKLLATASSDQTVMIWQYAGLNNFASMDKSNKEIWKRVHVLRGHEGDVLHIAWSPMDAFLATCSVDNTIIVWNACKFPKRVAVLEGHNNFVKGVVWDPAGAYLASQSDDKTLKIWSTNDWKCLATLKKPFTESGISTHFLRLDWSPDGTSVTGVHSLNNGGPVAKIIERNTWNYNNEFVGHRKAVTCTRFSPTMYEIWQKHENGSSKLRNCTFCACGSKDRAITVWSTIYKRPLVAITDLFSGNVMDLSWSQSSFVYLLACSDDGTVALVEFNQKELGKPFNATQRANHLRKLYGDNFLLFKEKNDLFSTTAENDDENSMDCMIIDDPKIYEQQKKLQAEKERAKTIAQSKNDENTRIAPDLVLQSTQNKQIESKTRDGKRKIRPIFLGTSVAVEDVALKQNVQENCTDIVEKNVHCDIPSITEEKSLEQSQKISEAKPDKVAKPVEVPVRVDVEKSRAENDSKRPIVVIDNKSEKLQDTNKIETAKPIVKSKVQKPIKRKNKPTAVIYSESESTETEEEAAPVVKRPKTDEKQAKSETRNAIAKTFDILFRPNLKRILNFTYQPTKSSPTDFSCQNDEKSSICCVTCITSNNNNRLWRTITNGQCTCLSANEHSMVLCFKNARLIILCPRTGRISSPYICVDSEISCVKCVNNFILVVTCKATVYVWKSIDELELVCEKTLPSMDAQNNHELNVAFTNITGDGEPMVTLSNGCSYLYTFGLKSWILINDSADSIACSSIIKLPNLGQPGHSMQIVENSNSLYKLDTNLLPNSSMSNEYRSLASLSYLEQKLETCRRLRCKRDFEHWLLQYANEASRQTQIHKMKDLCQSMLDRILNKNLPNDCQMDLNYRSLLNNILNIMARSVKMQRLYKEFREQLEHTAVDDFI